jgi:predicted GTPase
MLAPEDIDRLKEIFVTRQECDTTVNEIEKKLANDSTELALIKQKLDTITWVSKTTLGAVVVAIVGAIMALILK